MIFFEFLLSRWHSFRALPLAQYGREHATEEPQSIKVLGARLEVMHCVLGRRRAAR